MATVERKRIAFAPPDECALGPVKVYGSDGVTLIRIIPVEALRKMKGAVPAQRPPDSSRRGVPMPQVPMRRSTRREERL